MKTALNAANVRVFEAVARLQSVTRAAEELETSQPYVSKQLAVLEEQLNVRLAAAEKQMLGVRVTAVRMAQGNVVAITLLAGVEPILTRPGSREMSLGGWSLDVEGGGGQ